MMSKLRVPYAAECCSLKRVATRRTEGHFDWLSNQSCAPQVSLNISPCGCRLNSREQLAKNAELKGIPQFQDVQRREGEGRSTADQVRLHLRRIRICDVARNQKTAVSVMAGLQKGFSSRSRRTKLNSATRDHRKFVSRALQRRATLRVWFAPDGQRKTLPPKRGSPR